VTKIGEIGTTQAATSNRRTLRRNTECVVPSSPIFVTLMKEAPGSTETSVLTRATRRNNPEDTILNVKRIERLKERDGNKYKKNEPIKGREVLFLNNLGSTCTSRALNPNEVGLSFAAVKTGKVLVRYKRTVKP
jgi:hypothetical protein